jgi:hypothetical protein
VDWIRPSESPFYDNAYRSQLPRHSPNPRILNWSFLCWVYQRKLFLRLSGACGSGGMAGATFLQSARPCVAQKR